MQRRHRAQRMETAMINSSTTARQREREGTLQHVRQSSANSNSTHAEEQVKVLATRFSAGIR